MAEIYGDIPFFECLVRREYTRGLRDGHGEYLPAVAHAVQCKRGRSMMFQCIFTAQHAGAAFLLPIEALCWRPCVKPFDLTYVQPWDCFSDRFVVHEASFVARGAVQVLPSKVKAQYRFTLDWAGSDLADHFEQHKHMHVCFLESGLIGAFPNNRLLWEDPAFWTVTAERPDFVSLGGEYRAEGNQRLMSRERANAMVVRPVAGMGGDPGGVEPGAALATVERPSGRRDDGAGGGDDGFPLAAAVAAE